MYEMYGTSRIYGNYKTHEINNRVRSIMQVESKLSHINMSPGDVIKINVGISYKADVVIMTDGKLRVYYGDEECLEI